MVPRVKKTIILGTLDCQINDISAGEQSKIDSLLIHFSFKIQYFYIFGHVDRICTKNEAFINSVFRWLFKVVFRHNNGSLGFFCKPSLHYALHSPSVVWFFVLSPTKNRD